MPRKTSPRTVADSLSTIIAALGMLMAAFSEGPLRLVGVAAAIGAVWWFIARGQHLEGRGED